MESYGTVLSKKENLEQGHSPANVCQGIALPGIISRWQSQGVPIGPELTPILSSQNPFTRPLKPCSAGDVTRTSSPSSYRCNHSSVGCRTRTTCGGSTRCESTASVSSAQFLPEVFLQHSGRQTSLSPTLNTTGISSSRRLRIPVDLHDTTEANSSRWLPTFSRMIAPTRIPEIQSRPRLDSEKVIFPPARKTVSARRPNFSHHCSSPSREADNADMSNRSVHLAMVLSPGEPLKFRDSNSGNGIGCDCGFSNRNDHCSDIHLR